MSTYVEPKLKTWALRMGDKTERIVQAQHLAHREVGSFGFGSGPSFYDFTTRGNIVLSIRDSEVVEVREVEDAA